MNLSLRDVVCTSRDGDKFWKIPECYIRGNNIKYLRVPDEVIDKVVEEPKSMPPFLPPPPPPRPPARTPTTLVCSLHIRPISALLFFFLFLPSLPSRVSMRV
jgi:hypothetical protein